MAEMPHFIHFYNSLFFPVVPPTQHVDSRRPKYTNTDFAQNWPLAIDKPLEFSKVGGWLCKVAQLLASLRVGDSRVGKSAEKSGERAQGKICIGFNASLMKKLQEANQLANQQGRVKNMGSLPRMDRTDCHDGDAHFLLGLFYLTHDQRVNIPSHSILRVFWEQEN